MLKKITNNTLFKSAGIYTGANIINALIPFILMPILTRYLTPADYGVTAMLQVMVGMITPFVGLNLHGAIAVKYYKKNDIDFPAYVSNCFYILCISSFIMVIIFACFAHQISEYSAFPLTWLWSILLICFGQFLVNIVLTILQATMRAKFYACIQMAQMVFNLGLSLWLIVVLNFNWEGRVIAQSATVVVFAGLGLILLKRWKLLVWSWNREYIKDALKFGLPLIPHALSGYFITMADRFFITNLVGIQATGIYTVGAQIGMAMNLLVDSFNKAYAPWLYEKLSKPTEAIKKKIVHFTYIYFVTVLLIAIVFSLIMSEVLKYFLGTEFYDSGNYILGIALAGAFSGMYYMVTNYVFYTGKTYMLASITFAMGIVHVLDTYWAVVWFGSVGATYSSTFTRFLMFLAVWRLSARVYPMPWNLIRKRAVNTDEK